MSDISGGQASLLNDQNLTPAVLQYLKIKKRYPDCLLLFRMGDFYESFLEDAKTLSEDLQIVLTARGKGDKRVPLAGIPYHSVSSYLKKLVEKGRKVAICEQLEDPKFAKGIVKRDVVRVITPGTIIEDSLLSIANNYIMAIMKSSPSEYSISFADVSTGEFWFYTATDVLEELKRVQPTEVITPDNDANILSELTKLGIPHSLVEKLDFSSAEEFVKEFFGIATLSGYGIKKHEVPVVGILLHYLVENLRATKSHFSCLRRYDKSAYLSIDSTSAANLELVANMRDGSEKGTLFEVLNFTRSPLGRRRLKNWILQPLRDLGAIISRQEKVRVFYADQSLLNQVSEQLKGVHDVERIITRVRLGHASKRDILLLRDSLEAAYSLSQIFKHGVTLAGFFSELETFVDFSLLDMLSRSIDESPNEENLIKQGYDSELDSLRASKSTLDNWLVTYEEKEKNLTGIKSLKVRYNRVFGFFIEVSKSNLNRVPAYYERKQTQVSSERFTTKELRDKEAEILGLEERIAQKEKQLFDGVIAQIDNEFQKISALANLLADLDALHSLAFAALRNDYSMPVLTEGYELVLKECRHPVLEKKLPLFVPNDVQFSKSERMMIITGPNMAGKSTIMRQVCLAIIMAQIGSFVPAKKAVLPIIDKLFSRVGARDDILAGQSTFMVEMSETANILNNATEHSFIILDEIGRGTSTFDGICLAWSIAEYIAKRIGAKTMFATHYHQLNDMEGKIPGVVNYHVEVKEQGNSILFMHRLVRGGTDKSYGIHVARLSGLPEEILQRATLLMDFFSERRGVSENDIRASAYNVPTNKRQASLTGFMEQEEGSRSEDADA